MILPARFFSALLGLLVLAAQPAHAADSVEWLARASIAARQLNYTGNYTYRHGEHVELMRVSHRVDGKMERQKIEVLDGPHREFLRINDEVYCHLADGKTVRVDKGSAQRFFPSVLPKDPGKLALHYIPKLGGSDRVSGRDCQIVILEPRDRYRYTQMIWIDRATALPLKSQTVDKQGLVISVFEFSEIDIGTKPNKALFDVRMAGKHAKAAGFTAGRQDEIWTISLPPGYERIQEAMRPLPGVKSPVLHSVYSDGLSNISVFIEPVLDGAAGMEGLSTEGAINIYSRRVGGHKVTALGEVPAAALLETADSVQRK